MISVLLVLLFFSGCTQNSGGGSSAPISVTVHSAYTTDAIDGVSAKAGTFFVVTNMTIENHGSNAYMFNEKAVTLNGAPPLEEKLYTRLTDKRYWGKIPPNEKRTGNVIFGIKNSTRDFTLMFFYNNGQDSFTKELDGVTLGSGSGSLDTQTGSSDNKPTTSTNEPVTVTINSAFVTSDIGGSIPFEGKKFIVVNMTVKNNGETPYAFNENTVDITDGGPLTQKLFALLGNPFYWGSIPSHEMRTGEVVFSVPDSSQQYTVTLLNSNKQVIQFQKLGTLPVMNYYSSSLLPSGIIESSNFAYVVENLDTAEKTAAYTKEKFTFYDRKTCNGQAPMDFFTERKGDCLSYANFFSYVLAQHGYDVKKVSFKYHEGGKAWGHVVTLFTDRDGQLKYVTTPDLRVFRNVSSIDDLIAKEQVRLEITALDTKDGKPNVVTIPVGDLSSCH